MKKVLSLTLAVLMLFCSVSIPAFASSATTITVDSETINGNTVTIAGSVSTSASTPLEILVSKDGNKVVSDDITPDASGQFTYSFDAEESGNYDYVISEKISALQAKDVFAEDFADVPAQGTAGCWVSSGLATTVDADFGAETPVLKLSNARYLYDVNGSETAYGDPKSGTTYTVQADFKISADAKPTNMLVFRTDNTKGNFAANTQYVNQSGKAEAFQVRADGPDLVLIHAQNNKLQIAGTEKRDVLVSNYKLNQKYNVKIEMDLDTLTLKAYVDGVRALADEELYIFSQSPDGYRRLFEADTRSISGTTLYIANVALNRYDKAFKTGSVAYYSAEDVQAMIRYIKATDSVESFVTAINEKKDMLGIDTTKPLYQDETVIGSAYTDVKANATDLNSLNNILDKAEILYNLKSADKSGDLTAVEKNVKDYNYGIVYNDCSTAAKAALNTAATAYTFSDSIAVDDNINGWIAAMKSAYSTAIQAEGVSSVNYNAVYSDADSGIKVTGTITPAAAKNLKAVASAGIESFSQNFTANADGAFECIIPVQTESDKDFTVNIEAVNDDSTKTPIFSSEFDVVPTQGTNNVSNASNLDVSEGALKLGGGLDSRFIVNYPTNNVTSGIICGEAKIKKIDNNVITQLFSLAASTGKVIFAVTADKNGNFVLKYTEVGATAHLKSQMDLGSYDKEKWYTVGYEVNKANNMVSVFFENKKVLSFEQNTTVNTNIDRVIDVNAASTVAPTGTQYLDYFNCYLDNGTRIYADTKTVSVPSSITEISISSFNGNTATIKSPASTNATIIFATYNGDVLVQSEVKEDYTINKGTSSCSTSLSKNDSTAIKVFLWEDMDTLKPLCEGKSSNITQ